MRSINGLSSFAVLTFLFCAALKILPDVRIAWRVVWLGGAVTALLFTIGKELIGVYLGQGSVASGYGAGGSLIVILLWFITPLSSFSTVRRRRSSRPRPSAGGSSPSRPQSSWTRSAPGRRFWPGEFPLDAPDK